MGEKRRIVRVVDDHGVQDEPLKPRDLAEERQGVDMHGAGRDPVAADLEVDQLGESRAQD